jgi:hypothetical protein
MLDHLKETFHSLKQKHENQLQVAVSTPNQGQPKSNKEPDPQLIAITQKCINVFLASSQSNGEIGGLGYWQTANGYTAIALHDFYSGSDKNIQLLTQRAETVAKHHPGLINEFNDDTLWWGNCLLDVYQLNFRPELVEMAVSLHHHVGKYVIKRGAHCVKGMDMGGAVLWNSKPGVDQVNAITTGLYAELSARLAAVVQDSPRGQMEWLRGAEISLDWVFRCRYRAHEALVLDTIKLNSGECLDWTFTYNTGQAISACVALFEAMQPKAGQNEGSYKGLKSAEQYLLLACEMASKGMHRSGWVSQDGILTEHGAYGKGKHDPWKNNDAVGFKSVLIRALAKLYRVLGDCGRETQLKWEIGRFVERQFEALQEKDTNGKGQYGPWWDGPMECPTSHSQMAVLDVMAAVHLVRGVEVGRGNG